MCERERERESRHLMMEGTKMDRESLSSFVRSFTVIWSKEDQDKINRSKRGGALVVIFLPLSCFQLPSCQLPSSYSLIPFPLPHQTFSLLRALFNLIHPIFNSPDGTIHTSRNHLRITSLTFNTSHSTSMTT